MNGALCADAPTREFFDDIWPGLTGDGTTDGLADLDALEKARDTYCRVCPARRACLEMAMGHEDAKDSERHGLFGYLTPGQRRSVKKRRALRCTCGMVRDPVLLERGIYRCPARCGEPERRVDLIPVEGDQWSKRHTALARKVLSWIVDNVDVGAVVPPAIQMAETLECRRQDLGRVYAALVADGTLDKTGSNTPVYVRRWETAAMVGWTPRWLAD